MTGAPSNPLAWIASLVVPPVCHVCGSLLHGVNRFVCDACLAGIPRIANSPFRPADSPEKRGSTALDCVYICPQVEMSVAWMYYDKNSPYSALLHDIKYNGCSHLARFLGYLMASELKQSGIFNDVDFIVPVPLHIIKRLRRGYNQAEMLALGIHDRTGLPLSKVLKARSHNTQALLNTICRISNTKDVFYADRSCGLVNKQGSAHTRVLLIDDVCTTGATLYNAVVTLCDAFPEIRIRVLTLALTEDG